MLIMIERTRIRELLFVLLSLCHVVVQLEPARAATISKGDGKFCDFHLRGRIEPKDIEEFRHLVVTGDGSDALRVWWLCLNSEEGGNFQTALQMIDHMLEQGGYFKGIGTRVEPNSRCFSACALIFLAGKRLLGDSDSEIVREMHPTSTLGFHQPNYRQDVAASDSSQLFYAYEAGVTAIAKLLSYDANMFPKSLLVEFLKKRAGESFEISKIDDLGRWNINLYDYSAPVITLREQLYTFCANADGWRTGEPSSFPMEYVRNDPNIAK